MKLKVYASEHFEKSILWYIIFVIVVISVIILAILLGRNIGLFDYLALGMVLLVIMGYLYFNDKNGKTTLNLEVLNDGFVVGTRKISWMSIEGYVLEYNKKTQKIKNIVIIFSKNHRIHTINDTEENLILFVEELETYKPRLENYNQSGFDKFSRLCKL